MHCSTYFSKLILLWGRGVKRVRSARLLMALIFSKGRGAYAMKKRDGKDLRFADAPTQDDSHNFLNQGAK